MSLENWRENRWLTEHKTSREEISDLFRVIERDLSDCQAPGLSTDAQFATAYGAALQAARIALAASGYRPGRGESGHYYAMESLRLTVGMDSASVGQLQEFRKKRNVVSYDRAGTISNREAEEMKRLALRLRKAVEDWLRAKRPDLLPSP